MRPGCRRLQEKIKENVVEEIDNPYLKGGAESMLEDVKKEQ